jgi:hypothetical protein
MTSSTYNPDTAASDLNPFELLSMEDVVRQYRYPRDLLRADLKAGHIKAFQYTTGYGGRWYIPRKSIDLRITELMEAK